jgi:hypothetical protein
MPQLVMNLADYFAKNRYNAKYEFGARVFGKWNKIPFIGSVGNDSVVNELEGPRLSITLDLPIMYEGELRYHIIAKHKDVKRLTSFDTEETNDRKNTNSKASSKKPVLDRNGRNTKSR